MAQRVWWEHRSQHGRAIVLRRFLSKADRGSDRDSVDKLTQNRKCAELGGIVYHLITFSHKRFDS
eukprot:9217472-Ditylum_brightwellii.AAC.1